MNTSTRKWLRAAGLLTALVGMLMPGYAPAIEMTMVMQYRGEASGRFRSVTKSDEYCAVWPTSCANSSYYVADLPLKYEKRWTNRAPDLRDRWYIKIPAARKVDVVSESGHSYTLDFSFRALSQVVVRTSATGYPPVTPHPQNGCSAITSVHDRSRSRFIWELKDPQSAAPCYNFETNFFEEESDGRVDMFGARYMLVMPRPIGMPQGIYRGSLTYSIGPGGDFDFGTGVTGLSDDQLTIHFELDVKHDLYLQFPPGSDRAVLEPPGGWSAWLGGRGAPSRLYRDLPMRIWSSGPIKIYKRCQYELGGICGLRESSGHMVPVQVAVSLPTGMQHNGSPINKVTVPTHEAAALQIEAVDTVWNRPGQLHFEVVGSDVPSMLAHPGSRYEGLVTIVFEAQL